MNYIAYYRVSTDKQGHSGLGLEAQTVTVETYVQRHGGEIRMPTSQRVSLHLRGCFEVHALSLDLQSDAYRGPRDVSPPEAE